MLLEQIEQALIILQYHETLSNLTDEFRNRIPEKHLDQFEDLLLELQFISDKLSALEKNLYVQYLDHQFEDSEIKDYEIEDLTMIENLFKEDPKQVTPNLMEYVFEIIKKYILKKE